MKTKEDTKLINFRVELEKKKRSVQNKFVKRDIKMLENKITLLTRKVK